MRNRRDNSADDHRPVHRDNPEAVARVAEIIEERGLTEIASTPLRAESRVAGEVTAVRLVPDDYAPWLEATICDPSGRLTCTFAGVRSIGAVVVGTMMIVEGTIFERGGRRFVYNPRFDLVT